MGDLVFIGDVHLDRDDAALAPFVRLLERLGTTAARIVLLGDLFNLWIGRRDLERAHQREVLDTLAGLRRGGVVVRYVEGNRDYRIGAGYAGWAVDDADARGITERFGGHRIRVVHGDLANPRDLRYRAWRRLSRSWPCWRAFLLLPAEARLRLAESLERAMRRSNPAFKGEFPEAIVREYAAGLLARGHDVVVLGHFHVERDLKLDAPGPAGRLLVLPEWKGSRRHLRVGADGTIEFVDSE